ncbi:MAG: pyridinium-3,5-biscarboxylic acid mononucleotide synthase, partial [Candidatus Eremiobacteraeota bacterium]|nr:pyridinium-3,5-biscarboxylic acid mononucleotide synthase [Candidatus Eremiobacteraeota bacterium]
MGLMEISAVARLDHERRDRTGVPEVVFAAGKTLEQNVALVRGLYERAGFALATRVPAEQRLALAEALPGAVLEPLSGALRLGRLPRTGQRVAVVCAGTSDLPVAEEAAFALEAFGHDPVRATDV